MRYWDMSSIINVSQLIKQTLAYVFDKVNDCNKMKLANTVLAGSVASYFLYQYVTYNKRWWWNKRCKNDVCNERDWESNYIFGTVEPGWESVKEVFIYTNLKIFRARGEEKNT